MIFSPTESERFGCKVHRAYLNQINEVELYRQLQKHGTELLILRIPSEKLGEVVKLSNIGLAPIIADTLVYYRKQLEKPDTDFAWPEPLSATEVENAQKEQLSEVISDCFAGYTNHYTANPDLPTDAPRQAYMQWGAGFVDNFPEKKAWLVRHEKKTAGFFTMHLPGQQAEGTLAGVLPGFEGKGIYRQVIRFMQHFAARQNCSELTISTQVQHYRVQQVLADEGMRIFKSVNTIHINRSTKPGSTKQA